MPNISDGLAVQGEVGPAVESVPFGDCFSGSMFFFEQEIK